MRLKLIYPISFLAITSCGFNNAQPNPVPPTPVTKQPDQPWQDKDKKRGRVEVGVGYAAMRGANLYANYKDYFDSSIVEANTSLALSDKQVSGKQLFFIPATPYSLGYSAAFRDYKIVPNDSRTHNRQFSFYGVGSAALSEKSTLTTTVGIEHFSEANGQLMIFPMTATYRLDTRAHPQLPTEGSGYLVKPHLEISGIGEQYIKGSVRGQLDVPFKLSNELGNFAVSFKGFIGTETSLNNRAVPVVKRFFLENGSAVRGYAVNAFGYNSNGVPIGGSSMATASSELWMPFFHEDLRLYTFFDAGVMRGNGINQAQKELKTSAGAGVAWSSPIGMVSIYYGQALDKNPVNTQVIGLGLGINY